MASMDMPFLRHANAIASPFFNLLLEPHILVRADRPRAWQVGGVRHMVLGQCGSSLRFFGELWITGLSSYPLHAVCRTFRQKCPQCASPSSSPLEWAVWQQYNIARPRAQATATPPRPRSQRRPRPRLPSASGPAPQQRLRRQPCRASPARRRLPPSK